MSKRTLFISDLHLSEDHPEITNAFERFLEEQAKNADALYILGDFFETWVGDDDHSPFITHIKQQLKTLSDAGVALYFMRGNRDFLLGERFCADVNMTYLTDPTIITLNGERILLTHGDYLCTDDIAHQRFIKLTNNPLLRFLFLALPLCLRKKIARKIRQKSMGKQNSNYRLVDVNQCTVENWMKKHKVLTLIHGHTHQRATHRFTLNGQPAKRIVLSDWGTTYDYFESKE